MSKFQILDGGMGRELQRIGAPFQQPEWSALALMESPEMVTQAHRNFIDAGATIITTNTYALVPFHIGQERFEKDAFDLAEKAAIIAREAAKEYSYKLSQDEGAPDFIPINIAGCIPPAFGSYKPELFNFDQMESILFPLRNAQVPYIDFWLVETMSSIHEAECVLDMLRCYDDLPVWISFSMNNRVDFSEKQTLRSGESIESIAPILDKCDAVLFNCSQPEEMESAIKTTRALHPTIPIGAYANNFSEIKRTHAANEGISKSRDDITPEIYADFAKKWIDAGATIIGGCCGITPDHVKELAQRFK